MAFQGYLKQAGTYDTKLGPFVDKGDGVAYETGMAAAMDHATTGVRLSKNGAAFGDRSEATEPVYDAFGYYLVKLDATDTNTVGSLKVIFGDAAVCLPCENTYQVLEPAVYDALFKDAATGVMPDEAGVTELLTRIPDATAGANGGLTICGSNAAATFASLSVTGQLDAGNVLVDTTTVLTGNVTLSGTLGVGATTLASLTVTGALTNGSTVLGNTTIGTLGVGAISGTTLALSGAVTAASITLSGTLQAATIVSTGTTTLNAMTVTGAFTTGSRVMGNTTIGTLGVGAITGTTLALSGAVTAASVTLSGTLQAATIVSTGTTTLNALTVTGALTAGTNAMPWNAAWDTEVESECTDALNTYDPPTNAEMIARTLAAASYFDPAADAVATVTTLTNPVTLANGAHGGAAATLTLNGAAGLVATKIDAAFNGALTGNITGDITGNLSGSVGSVSGTVTLNAAYFTVAGFINANIQYVNDVLITGDGALGTEWGP